jgi:hypothetical protein
VTGGEKFLLIEVFLKGGKFVLLLHTALPPRFDEAESIAHELNECGGH